MAVKKKAEKNVDYKELCELYEHIVDHKNIDIDFLSEENEFLKKSVQGKDRFASEKLKQVEQLEKELVFASRTKSAALYTNECLKEANDALSELVSSVKVDRVVLSLLSIFLIVVIFSTK